MNTMIGPEQLAFIQAKLIDDPKILLDLIWEDRKSFWWGDFDVYAQDRAWYEKHKGKFDEGTLCPLLDEKWQEMCENNYEIVGDEERCLWDYIYKEWNSYPGDDQGDWEISGGDGRGWAFKLRKFKGRDMRDIDRIQMEEENWDIADLRQLYVGLVGLDRQLTFGWLQDELTYKVLWRRAQWEENGGEW